MMLIKPRYKPSCNGCFDDGEDNDEASYEIIATINGTAAPL